MRIKLQHAQYHPANAVDLDDTRQGFYFEIQADGNHETLATSEIYNSRGDALHAIGLIANPDTEIVDETRSRTIVTTTED